MSDSRNIVPVGQSSAADDRPIGDIAGELASASATLLRSQLELAERELSTHVEATARDVVWVAGALLLAHFAGLAAVAALILGLAAAGLDPWVAGLLVAIVLALPAAVIVPLRVAQLRRRRLLPSRALQSMKETFQWISNHLT